MAIRSLIRTCSLLAVATSVIASDESCSGSAKDLAVCKDLESDRTVALATELLQTNSHRVADKSSEASLVVEAQQQQERKAELSSRKQTQRLPGWDDIVDAASDAVDSVSSSVSDAASSVFNSTASAVDSLKSGNATGGLQGIVDQLRGSVTNATYSILGNSSAGLGALADAAADTVASALNSTLIVLNDDAQTFVDACDQAKEMLLLKINETDMKVDALVKVLEENATFFLDQATPFFHQLTNATVASTSTLMAALAAVGLGDVGAKLNSTITGALTKATAVEDSLSDVSKILAKISDFSNQALEKQLEVVQDTLSQGLDQADTFARNFSASFGDFTDMVVEKLADAIPGANYAAIDAKFDSIDELVAELAAKLVSGPADLVSGLSSSVGTVQDVVAEVNAEKGATIGVRASSALLLVAAFVAMFGARA
eukprot:CAMPEP_0206471100 /NCGR_PEP_ID=MMETSP0324_2-20121206/31347_1 /ASSEMBLY_ACC=CAM_ASM_000836 /TAXON_ID=2866 /ORGANISM="Crypthecodinium cohnii, Strain Seligo" /LENGTH=429 /DNA_ID=CAMNT_0053945331 /DNA_START=122 /DNA_END=1411 /DNA_ORIENTATION=+